MLSFDPRSKTMLGYCDLGYGPEEDGQVATEVMVFLLTGLRGSWKAPVAYFFTSSLCSETLQQLLLHTLEHLHSHAFSVDCVTMDGHASNLAVCKGLGAKINLDKDVQSFFIVNDRKIFILLDPCHMIKLVRNMLHALGTIQSEDGLIQWTYIDKLHRKQGEIGLKLGNKITARHVSFQRNKMKVRSVYYIGTLAMQL